MKISRPRVPIVILDANILLSYLLTADRPSSPILQIVNAAVEGRYTLVLSNELIAEVISNVRAKAYFSARIPLSEVEMFIGVLSKRAKIPVSIEVPERRVRDRYDDYLIAYAIENDADFIVSGDKGVLVADGRFGTLRIVTAVEFLELLEAGESE